MTLANHLFLISLDQILADNGHRKKGRHTTIADRLTQTGVVGLKSTNLSNWLSAQPRADDGYRPAEYDDSLSVIARQYADDPSAILFPGAAPDDEALRERLRIRDDDPAPAIIEGIAARLPEPDAPPDTSPIVIEGERIAVLSDIHIPHHHMPAIEAALGITQVFRPDAIVLNGDIVDMYAVSTFDRNPAHWDLFREIGQAREFLSLLRYRFPRARIYYKVGNHEERLQRFILQNAAALHMLPDLQLWQLLRLDAFGGYVMADRNRYLMAGDLPIIHGHEVKASASLHAVPAQALFNKVRGSGMIGHLHRQSRFAGVNLITGERQDTYTLGCLCSLVPEYARHNKWSHGMATIELAGGHAEVTLHDIKP